MDDDEYSLACTTKYAYDNNLAWGADPYAYTYAKTNWNKDTIDSYRETYLWDYYENERSRRFASEIVKKLKEANNKIIIITTRWTASDDTEHGEKVRKLTVDWLKENEIMYDDIIFTQGDKVKECIDKKIDIIIEDSPRVINAVKNIVKYVICYDNRYNVEIKGDNIVRIFSWYDLYKKINELLNK